MIFGKFCLLERISVGGMAEVFRAKPFDTPEVERYLAIKRILPNLAEDAEFVQMFVDEAKAAIRLNHPNIAQLYELAKLGSAHYIVMEFVAGQELLTIQKRLRKNGKLMAVGQAVHIASKVARALDHAHSAEDDEGEPLHIVHRDVSPQNVLISYSGEVKLIDFGIAKMATQSLETQVGVLKGKFSYMSPEQVRGKPVDRRSDLFALGAVLYEMLCGRRLFHGESDFHTLEQVREAKFEPPSTYNERVPEALDEILNTALAREAGDRYATCDAFADALDGFLSDAGSTYDQDHLSKWMVGNFDSELEAERRMRDEFASFVTPEDVREHNAKRMAAISAAMEASAEQEADPDSLESDDVARTEVMFFDGTDEDASIVEWGPPLPLDALESSPGVEEEILAESVLLPAMLDGEVLAHLDLPDPVHESGDSALFEPHADSSGRRPLLLFALLVVVAAASGFGAIRVGLFATENVVAPPSDGMIMLEAMPSEGIQVFLDGALVSEAAPAAFDNLAAGEHWLEIRHPERQVFRRSVMVEAGRTNMLQVALEPLANDPARVRLALDPPDAEIWLDEQPVVTPEDEPLLLISSWDRHLLEVRAPGHFVWREEIVLDAGEARTIDIQLQPAHATLIVHSEPPGNVFIDDEDLGPSGVELILEGLDPRAPCRVRIEPTLPGYRAYETTVFFEGAQTVDLFARLPRIGEPRSSIAQSGWLTVDSGDHWYRLVVDGRDTGLTTPVSDDAPMALEVGDRVLTLTRGTQALELLVTIEPDQATRIACNDQDGRCAIQ